MRYYEIALTQSGSSPHGLLTYSSNLRHRPGELVQVTLRNKNNVGVVIRETSKPEFKTKPIGETIDGALIPSQLIKLASWISQYYQAPLDVVMRMMVPRGVSVKRRAKMHIDETAKKPKRRENVSPLTADQNRALDELSKELGTSLLHGVTGSGKTKIYIELARQNQKSGLATIVLVPEISLTSQILADFQNELGNVFVTHSMMTESERHKAWLDVAHSKAPIVIGPRSALFSPIDRLGLIVIDESHDQSYKQESSPRYDALKAARKLADYHKAKLILGSATSSVTDYYIANQRSQIVDLPKPIAPNESRTVSVVDMRRHKKSTLFSAEFIDKLKQSLDRGEQALIYHNRRGSAPLVLCSQCGWAAKCPNCFIPLVLHMDEQILRCHCCSFTRRLPTSCPECSNTDMVYRGVGTKKIVSEIEKLLPDASVARFDTDNPKKSTLAKRYQELYDGSIDIIVGTQMVAKGLDLPRLSFGGVVLADTGLSMPDYGANEKVFQLLHQFIGRIGRHTKSSNVVIQTMSPDNPVIRFASRQDYNGFYSWEINQRKAGKYPPFRHLLTLTCSYASRHNAKSAATKARQFTEILDLKGVQIDGPAPSLYERRGKKFRWQLFIRSKSRANLVEIAAHFASNPKWTVDLDPSSLL